MAGVRLAPLLGTGPLNDQSQSPVAWAVLGVARRETRKATLRAATASATTAQTLAVSPNLLANPGAEIGDPSLSGFSAVSMPGWTVTGTPTVIQYGTLRNFWPVGLSFAMPDFPPFLNSLINAYGLADNYYALTHGSSPNYYPIVGGTDYGITYNCASPGIDASTTLVSNIDDAGKTWRSYAQGLTPGASPLVSTDSYQFGETVFPAFTSIANDPAYAQAHILPLEQMAIDLQSASTAPNYAWFAADENFAGEGPVNSLVGLLKFAFNQIDPRHQYNVPALDQFLSETVPTIMNSAVWNDVAEKSVLVVTFDEDNNNLDLGFGNEGNHIVTVVIPSPGAIAAGMRSGPFIASNHYNHYSLLRMIEDSLGLPSLTNNDAYAAPMNEFWTSGVVGNSGNIAV